MSLDNPSRTEKIVAVWQGWPMWARAGVPLLILLVATGAVLWSLDAFGDWRFRRGVKKDKAEIKQSLANIANKEQTIANLQTEIAVEKEKVRADTETLLKDTATTDEAKAETNKALANLDAAKNANTTNSSVTDLERLLEQLDK